MEFRWKNQTKKLVGIDGKNIQAASIEEITKGIRPSHALFAVCLQVAQTELQQSIHPSLHDLLQEFSYLFMSLQAYHQHERLTTTLPLRKEPNRLMFSLTDTCTIKRTRSRSRSKICCNPGLCDPALAPSRCSYY